MDLFIAFWFIPVYAAAYPALYALFLPFLPRAAWREGWRVWWTYGLLAGGGMLTPPAYLVAYLLFPLLRFCNTPLEGIEPFGWFVLACVPALVWTVARFVLAPPPLRLRPLVWVSSAAGLLCASLFLRMHANLDMEACRL